MPSMLSHYLFASSLLSGPVASAAAEQSLRSGLASAVALRPDLVLAGAQGPDPFFYYGAIPIVRKKDKSVLNAFGEELHARSPEEVFPALAAAAAGTPSPERDDAFAYLYGLLSHYLLDRAWHPYVFYRTGFDAEGRLTGEYAVDHTRFETLIGVEHLELRRKPPKDGSRPGAAPPFALTEPNWILALSPPDMDAAGRLWASAFPDVLGPDRFRFAWNDMRAVLSLLWDPTGFKSQLLTLRGRSSSKARALIPPLHRKRKDPIDYLNLSGAPWRHPVDGTGSRASLPDLTGGALSDGVRALALLDSFYAAGPEEAARAPGWEALLGGVNHDGCRPGSRMLYFDSVYAQPKR